MDSFGNYHFQIRYAQVASSKSQLNQESSSELLWLPPMPRRRCSNPGVTRNLKFHHHIVGSMQNIVGLRSANAAFDAYKNHRDPAL